MNTNWEKSDLEKINYILKRLHLNINDDYSFNNIYDSSKNISYRTYISFNDEFTNLLLEDNKEEILSILKLTKPIRFLVAKNKENELCIGLLSNLAKIDYNNPTEIFRVATLFIKEYSTLSYKLVEKYASKYTNSESFIKVIDKIKTSSNETEEEKYIRKIINQKLKYVNGIDKNYLIQPFINKCNSKLREIILNAFYIKLRSMNKIEENLNQLELDIYRSKMIEKQEKRKNLHGRSHITWR